MASRCKIAFDNNQFGVYYAGQTVSGTAELITQRPKTIRSIYIAVSGFGEVRWTESVTRQNAEGKSEKSSEIFSASELYYSSEKNVYGQSGGPQMELPAGKYVFPFQASVPPNAPTSFNGTWGQIKHEVTLVIDRVVRYNNTFQQPFSVISPYDLNVNPKHASSLQHDKEQTFFTIFNIFSGSKRPMTMKVRVPHSAYAPGQKVRFNIVLDNQSDINCSDVKVRLMKKVVYTSRSPNTKNRVIEIKVIDNHCGGVDKLNKAEFNEFLQIPATTPSSSENCSIIKVTYSLQFKAKVSAMHSDLVIEFPFTIGTIPIYASINEQKPNQASLLTNLPPPIFEEDVRSEQFENSTFKPRYPVFPNEEQKGANSKNATSNFTPGSMYPSLQNSSNALIGMPLPQAAPEHSFSPQAPKCAPPKQPTNTIPLPQNNITVLGFSIPPDYQPTPSAPPPAPPPANK